MFKNEYFQVLEYLYYNKNPDGVDLYYLLEEILGPDSVQYFGDRNELKLIFLRKMTSANDISFIHSLHSTKSDFMFSPNLQLHTRAQITEQGEKFLLNRKSRGKSFFKDLFKPELTQPTPKFIKFWKSEVGKWVLNILAGLLISLITYLATSYSLNKKTSTKSPINSSPQAK